MCVVLCFVSSLSLWFVICWFVAVVAFVVFVVGLGLVGVWFGLLLGLVWVWFEFALVWFWFGFGYGLVWFWGLVYLCF